MFNLQRTFSTLTLQKNVVTGQVVDREGVLVRAVLTSGLDAVQKADGSASTYQLVGFAMSDNQTIAIAPLVELGTIPASPGPYTITLSNNNLVGTAPNVQMQVHTASSNTLWTQSATAPSTTQYQPAPTTGIITFASADAGTSLVITYRYNLTVLQAQTRYFQRNINNTAGSIFNTIGVLTGAGEIYTGEFDATIDWTAGATITSGADGILTTGGSGTALTGSRVIHVPDSTDPTLGITFNFQP